MNIFFAYLLAVGWAKDIICFVFSLRFCSCNMIQHLLNEENILLLYDNKVTKESSTKMHIPVSLES